MAGLVFVESDSRFLIASQSAKGTLGTTYSTAEQIVSMDSKVVKLKVDGVPGQGGGKYPGKAFPTSWNAIETDLEVRWTAGAMSAMVFPDLTRTTTVLTGADVGAFSHRYDTTNRIYNYQDPYYSIAAIRGGGVPATAALKRFLRDSKISKRAFVLDSLDVFKASIAFMSLNEGVGTGSETFAYDTTQNQVIPNSLSNAFVYPAWYPSGLCVTNLTLTNNLQVTATKPCIGGGGEPGNLITSGAGWTLSFDAIADDVAAVTLYNQINALVDPVTSASSAITAGFKEGAFSCAVKSTSLITGTTKPYSFGANFPDLQWLTATWNSNANPNTISFQAVSFDKNMYFTIVNDKTALQMTI